MTWKGFARKQSRPNPRYIYPQGITLHNPQNISKNKNQTQTSGTKMWPYMWIRNIWYRIKRLRFLYAVKAPDFGLLNVSILEMAEVSFSNPKIYIGGLSLNIDHRCMPWDNTFISLQGTKTSLWFLQSLQQNAGDCLPGLPSYSSRPISAVLRTTEWLRRGRQSALLLTSRGRNPSFRCMRM